MLTIRSVVLIFAFLILSAGMASGQNYPNRPVRIFTGSVGGTNDSASRLIASGIAGPLGQPVIVENRPALIATETVAKSPPDGHNLTVAGDQIWVGPLLQGNSDAIRDFSPISMLGSAANILAVHPSLPVKSVKELIALAKARPGELNYSSASPGGANHIAAELFKSMTGVNLVQVGYAGSEPAATAVARGEVQLMFGGATLMAPYMKAGKVRPLAVTSAQPSALAAGLPTVAASGLPGYEVVETSSLYAPAKTPAAIVNRLNQEVVRFLRTKEAQEKYLALGAEVIANSPEEHAAKLKSRIAIIGKLIKDLGIKDK